LNETFFTQISARGHPDQAIGTKSIQAKIFRWQPSVAG